VQPRDAPRVRVDHHCGSPLRITIIDRIALPWPAR
jgi:hypothetical protein